VGSRHRQGGALLEGESPKRACRRDRCADADFPRHAELAGDQAENDRPRPSPMSIAALAVPDAAPRCDGSAVAKIAEKKAGVLINSVTCLLGTCTDIVIASLVGRTIRHGRHRYARSAVPQPEQFPQQVNRLKR
jgi:hypothetical protein